MLCIKFKCSQLMDLANIQNGFLGMASMKRGRKRCSSGSPGQEAQVDPTYIDFPEITTRASTTWPAGVSLRQIDKTTPKRCPRVE